MKRIYKIMSSKEFDISVLVGTVLCAAYNFIIYIPAMKNDKRFKDIK